MTELEITLPMFFNLQTHHFLYCRLPRQMELWGRLWAGNILCFERNHIGLRSMARSSKCMLMSIYLNYVNFLSAQLEYRFTTTFVNEPRPSALCARTEMKDEKGECEPGNVQSAPDAHISDRLFSHIIDNWVKLTDFEPIRANYFQAMETIGVDRMYANVHMSEYDSQHPSEAMRSKFQINRDAKVRTTHLHLYTYICTFRIS
jgi:hypothetical protein